MENSDTTSHYELRSFRSPEDLAQAAAVAWLEDLRLAQAQARRYCVALSGGRIAAVFFKSLSGLARGGAGLFEFVEFFWGDERCVPPADLESNFAMARDFLLKPLGIPDERIHRVKGELEPEIAAAQAEEELRTVAGDGERLRSTERLGLRTKQEDDRQESAGQPVLDLVFLGMGEEGHTASLFPGEPEDVMASPAVYRPVVAAKPPPHRITLGYPTLASARQVWLLASGEGKAGALRESLQPDGRTPLARVIRMRKTTIIFADVLLET